MNLCLNRGRTIPKLSIAPLTPWSSCTSPPAPSALSSRVTAPASTSAWSATTATKCGGPSLLPRRRFSVSTLSKQWSISSTMLSCTMQRMLFRRFLSHAFPLPCPFCFGVAGLLCVFGPFFSTLSSVFWWVPWLQRGLTRTTIYCYIRSTRPLSPSPQMNTVWYNYYSHGLPWFKEVLYTW